MKPKIIKLQLPADLEQKARELAGTRRLHTVIVEALRAQWFPVKSDFVEMLELSKEELESLAPSGDIYPVYGSIPAERKPDA